MTFQQPFSQVVHKRFSCRNYSDSPISKSAFDDLESYIAILPSGPFDGSSHFHLIVANEGDRNALRGLGTYGTIKNPVGFIVGATRHGEMDMEDFGYRMEMIVLKATDLDLSTCWLGGLFTRSAFVKKIGAAKGEILPAICSVGYPASEKSLAQVEQSRRRLGGEALFFADDFTKPLSSDQAGEYAYPLEMLRLAPSARNLQPWRIVKQGKNWHFYLQRTQGYHQMVLPAITGISDLQRIDMGIGMAHFETAAHDSSLTGRWQVVDPGIQITNKLMEYSVSWIATGNG
jgi:hypothetical protein